MATEWLNFSWFYGYWCFPEYIPTHMGDISKLPTVEEKQKQKEVGKKYLLWNKTKGRLEFDHVWSTLQDIGVLYSSWEKSLSGSGWWTFLQHLPIRTSPTLQVSYCERTRIFTRSNAKQPYNALCDFNATLYSYSMLFVFCSSVATNVRTSTTPLLRKTSNLLEYQAKV